MVGQPSASLGLAGDSEVGEGDGTVEGGQKEAVRGHIARKGKRWYVVVDDGRTEDGRRKQKWSSGFVSRKEAQQHLTEVLGQLDKGGYVAPTKETVAAFMSEWLTPARHSYGRGRGATTRGMCGCTWHRILAAADSHTLRPDS